MPVRLLFASLGLDKLWTVLLRTGYVQGVDEFFISLTADSAELHDSLTELPGAFEKTLRAIHNLEQFPDVRQMTNTVITKLSYRCLPQVVEHLKDVPNLVEMDFWNYWPMTEDGDANLLVSHFEVQPLLRLAIRLDHSSGRQVEVRNFPQCLLGSDADTLINDQPELRIDPRSWNEFNRNGFHQCAFREVYGSRQCLGLNGAFDIGFDQSTK